MSPEPRKTRKVVDPGEEERERISRSFLALALSHELKQPLNALALNGDLLTRRLAKLGAAAADAQAPLESICKVVDRVNDCLESFLPHVAPDPPPDQPLDLLPVIEGAAARARAIARRLGVRVVEEVQGDLPKLAVHPVQLGVALDSLLDNALRACRRGGAVTLRAHAEDDELRIEILDEGEGMSADVAKRAFHIGYSSWGRRGIGLPVAKFVAYAHGGGFQIESREGQGTTVSLVFPVG